MNEIKELEAYVETLKDHDLDREVLFALGFCKGEYDRVRRGLFCKGNLITPVLGSSRVALYFQSFCHDWSTGGMLIERYQISVYYSCSSGGWDAFFRGTGASGSTPLEAAMRALVLHTRIHSECLHDFTGLTADEALDQIFTVP